MHALGMHAPYGGGPSRNFRLPYAHSGRDGLNDGYDDQFGRLAGVVCHCGDETEASHVRVNGILVEPSSSLSR